MILVAPASYWDSATLRVQLKCRASRWARPPVPTGLGLDGATNSALQEGSNRQTDVWPLDLLSDEHFTVDGTLLEACASLKSFRKMDGSGQNPPQDPGNPTVNFHGEKRSNDTHQSTTDPDAMLARKGSGKEAS